MNYALGYCFNGKELFENFNLDRLKMTSLQVKEIFSDGNKRDFCAKIFMDALKLVMNDIVENNTHFKMPGLGRTQSYLYMKRTTGDAFKRAYRRGKWNDIDPFTSFMSGYLIFLRMESKKRTLREKPVYIGGRLKQRLVDLTNQGKQY